MLENKRVILASASPRRAELIKKIVDNFEIIVSDIDEACDSEEPEEIAKIISMNKAKAVASDVKDENAIIIAADTLVWKGTKQLGKPKDREDAINMLSELSGVKHKVYTGVAIISAEKEISFCTSTELEFYPLSLEEITAYVDTGEPMDKSGSYGIQDGAAIFVKSVNGDYPSVMGLPVAELYRQLKNL